MPRTADSGFDAAVIDREDQTVAVIQVKDGAAGVALADAIAPEHLELMGDDAEDMVERVTRAGCVFLGEMAGTAFGDYVAGSNHVLPTGGAARWASPLRVDDFVRWTTRVRARGDLGPAARAGAAVARYEGMRYHAASMELRG